MSNFTCQSKSFINIFSTCQVSACELQPFSCHNLANDIYSETAKIVFSHLNYFLSVFYMLEEGLLELDHTTLNTTIYCTTKQQIDNRKLIHEPKAIDLHELSCKP